MGNLAVAAKHMLRGSCSGRDGRSKSSQRSQFSEIECGRRHCLGARVDPRTPPGGPVSTTLGEDGLNWRNLTPRQLTRRLEISAQAFVISLHRP